MERKINTGETKGINRKIDNLGRVVIPIEFRHNLNLNVNDITEIFLLQDGLFIKKV